MVWKDEMWRTKQVSLRSQVDLLHQLVHKALHYKAPLSINASAGLQADLETVHMKHDSSSASAAVYNFCLSVRSFLCASWF